MAKHLITKGHQVTVYTQPASRGRARRAGAKAGTSPADVARQSSIVITMVPDTPDVELVISDPTASSAQCNPQTIIIDMRQHLSGCHEAAGVDRRVEGATLLDAPVSGGEIGAINAALSIMVGGDAAAFAKVRPVLECMGNPERIVHIAASRDPDSFAKSAIRSPLAARSRVSAKRWRWRARQASMATRSSGAARRLRSSRVLEVHGERMLKSDYKPGFRTRLYQKDMRLANEAAAAHAVAMPATALVTQLVNALVASGGADLDYSAIGTVSVRVGGEVG